MRLGLELRGTQDRAWKRASDRARRGRAGRRAERRVLLHQLDALADLVEHERKVAQHLRPVEAALPHPLVERGREQEALLELVGLDLHQDLVVVGVAVEREHALDDLHVLDDFIEWLVVAGLGRVGFGGATRRVGVGLAGGLGGILGVARSGALGERGSSARQPEHSEGQQAQDHASNVLHLDLLTSRVRPQARSGGGGRGDTLAGRAHGGEPGVDGRGISRDRRRAGRRAQRGGVEAERTADERSHRTRPGGSGGLGFPPGGGPGAGVKPDAPRSSPFPKARRHGPSRSLRTRRRWLG